MSLLNDALRKKQAEQQPADRQSAEAILKPAVVRRNAMKPSRKVVLCAATVLFAAVGGWFLWSALGATARSAPAPAIEVADAQAPAASDETASVDSETSSPAAQVSGKDPTQSEPGLEQHPAATGKITLKEKTGTTVPLPDRTVTRQTGQPDPGRIAQKPRPQKTPEINKAQASGLSEKQNGKKRGLSAEPLFTKARTYHRQGRFSQAIDMYLEVLKIDPNHADVLFNLTSAYLQTGDFSMADRIAGQLHVKEPANHDVTLNLAIARIGIGYPDQAIQLLDGIAEQPGAPLFDIFFHKGVALRHLNRLAEAVAWYRKAEQIRSNDPPLLFNLAVAFDQQQQYAPAVDYYLKYLKESKETDLVRQKQIQRRIRTLRADLAQPKIEEE